MLLAHKSDLLYLSKGPFQSQTYTLYHLQPTPAKLSVTKLQAPRSPFPMLKGNETCTIASSQTLMAAQLNTHLNLHRRTHPPFPFFFFFWGCLHHIEHPPRADWQNGAAQVEWFTCWTGGYGFESHHFSLGADTVSEKVIKRQCTIQRESIAHFYDCVQPYFTMFFFF